MGFANPKDLLNGLQFQDQSIFDQHVHPVSAVQTVPLVFDRQRPLKLERDLCKIELACQALLIG